MYSHSISQSPALPGKIVLLQTKVCQLVPRANCDTVCAHCRGEVGVVFECLTFMVVLYSDMKEVSRSR